MKVADVHKAHDLLHALEEARKAYSNAADMEAITVMVRTMSKTETRAAYDFEKGGPSDFGFTAIYGALLGSLHHKVKTLDRELRELGVTP